MFQIKNNFILVSLLRKSHPMKNTMCEKYIFFILIFQHTHYLKLLDSFSRAKNEFFFTFGGWLEQHWLGG